MVRIEHLPLDDIYTTSYFGPRIYKNMKWHNGIDLRAIIGKPVYVIADGYVRVAKINAGKINTGYGKYVVLEHKGFNSLYAHLNEYIVKEGQLVKAGTIIGYTGNTGDSEAPHLHFEIRLGEYNIFWTKCPSDENIYMYCVNPLPYINALLIRQSVTPENAMEIIARQAHLEEVSVNFLNSYIWRDNLKVDLAKAMLP
jgi:murein DD-endopeptidase MepM/ murein hydrolase activator NlpD